MKPSELPRAARVTIVGGGIVGASVAYHLAKLGVGDVLLLEQGALSGGTTWHAAGLVGCLRTSVSMTRINQYSAELYARLEAETGVATGWNEVGSILVARTPERMTQLRRTAAMAEIFDVEAKIISPDEVAERWPLMRTEDLLGAAWLPGDGKVNPEGVTRALAAGARQGGVAICENARVLEVVRNGRRATGVKTAEGVIASDCVVLCGGMWTRELGLRCGVAIPLYPVEHHYVVSDPMDGLDDDRAVVREPDEVIYFRSEGSAVLLGAFQAYTKAWMVDRVPADFSFQLLEADWEKFEEPLAAGKWRVPALEKAQFPRFVNGPESFTPDNNFILGEAPELDRLFVAAGFNSGGIACAGGAGRALAEWIVEGQATSDLSSVDIRRFAPFHNNRAFLRQRVTEVVGLHYQLAWPNRELESGRGLRRTPLHERLARAGAVCGQKMGWERANWFAPAGVEPRTEYSFGRQNWFDHVAREHRAARQSVALFDQTSFSKYELSGADALAVLQRLAGGDVDVAPGRIVYTGLFNERGGFESDLTILREEEDRFYIVTSTAQARRDFHWIERHTAAGAGATLRDVTTAHGVIGVMGPNARELLGRVTDADLSNEAFPFGSARTIEVGCVAVRALRLTYVGELGWELHVPVEQMASVYDVLKAAGRELELVDAGHYAINSLRLEKAYRAWGADIGPADTPLEADLAFAVAWDKGVEFIGRQALVAQKKRGVEKRLVTFLLEDPQPVLWGSEPILRDGVVVGHTTSGAYAHSLGAAIAMGYVTVEPGSTAAAALRGGYEIDIAGERFRARPFVQAPYDPERQRILDG